MTLEEIYAEASKELTDKKAIDAKFIYLAKQKNPEVTLQECKKHLGYTSEDEKKDTNLNQKFRADIYIPLRNYLTSYEFGLNSIQADEVWKRENSTEENQNRRAVINAKLPKSTRERSGSNSIDYCSLLGLESKE